ncbi:MAG TPA: hypothetical protein VMZ28_31400 [Kofleriaceae bacterium]|nr:hypothetical protein [Kofleriaceae bacterium]
MRAELVAPGVAVAVALALAACTSATPAPPTARITMQEAQRSARGAWINVSTVQGDLGGELLAASSRELVLETPSGIRHVPARDVRSVALAWYEADNSAITGINVLGTLSTLSHGFFLILTAPILWWGGGTAMARAQSRRGHESMDISDWRQLSELALYARFPAGMPEGFDGGRPLEGRAGERCYPNRTCDHGLTCQGGVCKRGVAPP